jgi:hypothetical protein
MRIKVSGLARCGSSLTLQMLAAGGFPCWGIAPDYESATAPYDHVTPMAFKILKPQMLLRTYPSDVTLWLDRDVDEQAKSVVKYVEKKIHKKRFPKWRRREMTATTVEELRQQYRDADRWLKGEPHIRFAFEDMVDDPRSFIDRVDSELSLGLDIDGAMSVYVRRGPSCLPFFLEARLLKEQGRS